MKTTIYATLVLALLSTASVLAQSRFGISISAAPTYSYANSTQTVYLPAGAVPTAPVGSIGAVPVVWSIKTTAWGYVLGGMIHYQFTPNWSASTGLWYTHSQRSSIDSLPYTITPIRTRIHGLQIPLFVNYRLTSKRLSPYFSAGGLASFRQRSQATYEAGSGLSTLSFFSGKSVSYQAVLGAGISYRLNTHLSLIAQPMLIWNFRPKGDISQYTSYQINGQTQLVYSF